MMLADQGCGLSSLSAQMAGTSGKREYSSMMTFLYNGLWYDMFFTSGFHQQ
jgi:hypothetical protein